MHSKSPVGLEKSLHLPFGGRVVPTPSHDIHMINIMAHVVVVYNGHNHKPVDMAENVQVRGDLFIILSFTCIRHVVQEVHIGKGP